jgi:hypothetical protein
VDDRAQTGVLLPEAGGGRGRLVVDEEHLRLRLPEGVNDLGQAPAGVHGGEHAVRPGHREQELGVAVGVERQDPYAFAIAHTERAKGTAQPGDPIGLLVEGPYALAEDGGRRVGVVLHGSMQTLGKIHDASSDLRMRSSKRR